MARAGRVLAALLLALLPVAPARAVAEPASSWTGSWETAPSGTAPALRGAAVRNVVHLSVGGTAVRIRVSNRLGSRPLRLGAVTVALRRAAGPDAVPGSMRTATFHGSPTVTVPPGRDTVSDPVALTVPAAADLLVTVYTPDDDGPATHHRTALQTSYVAPVGAGRATDPDATGYTRTISSWYYVTGVDVRGAATGSVVAFGDSLTDGQGSTPDTNHRWPDRLAEQLRTRRLGVLNAGIGGNRLLHNGTGPSALARLDADALDRAGVRALVVFEGINDIKGTPEANDAEAYADAYRTLVARAHARGIRVIGVTLTPYRGYPAYTAARESVRQRVNAFLRTGGAFDAVADADAAVRDPADPTRILPRYDPGDHLHFDDAGMAAVADTVLLALTGAR
ncbi:SGNH hydrolase [Streptomyces pluripotens]|uniref:SGNH hydrolase n=1 Tax=Streptomyces pluripotens TaxID=1355015 RepID=A0A221P4Y8_9ACTN|nr:MULTISPECIES: SGNH/GDSL hydrolase family protein [Streptomyces]ARP73009.1 SGNH hydrolase [Streptomyces pluripotens]ASN27260.1 SGNH hydrolase [Streptomyces pluripotens]KIE28745.1 SGNH hydrolase [Streptomyces sp. MUSC 125]MCH0557920.1 SGNH/GDSL hydrolase family protein [Streptomyces sp. MUM 16J]